MAIDQIRVPIRQLVEYVYRGGSIDSGFRSTATMTEGTKAHQRIQKTYKKGDQSEVHLETTVEYDGISYIVEGRCDGLLFSEDGEVTIDEIKSSNRDLSAVTPDSYPVHWAQAKCYAYIYALEHALENIQVQVTYTRVRKDENKRFQRTYTMDELKKFMDELIGTYAPFAGFLQAHRKRRNESIQKLDFPFPEYRKGQRKLAGAVYKTIADDTNLFAQAPTGTGKTISTLFPSIKAIGEAHAEKLFYLTAKTITRETAEEAMGLMHEKGLDMTSVTITAKDKICFKEKTLCTPEYCEYADGYYDRVNEGILDLLKNERLMTRGVLEQYAHKHTLCPFELSLDTGYAADAFISDYNYIFDPAVSLKRLQDEAKKRTLLLVDEAHNLVDRARDMYSAEIKETTFRYVQEEMREDDSADQALEAICDHLKRLSKDCREHDPLISDDPDIELLEYLDLFVTPAERILAENGDEGHDALLNAYFEAMAFIRAAKFYDARFKTYVTAERGEVTVKILCLDPSYLLKETSGKYKSRINFSATLSPFDYFLEMLGKDSGDYTIRMRSPFEREKTDLYVVPLSTRYRDRERTRVPMAKAIGRMLKEHQGNFLVFFPSYQYMLDVYSAFRGEAPEIRTIVQDSGMTEPEREAFLENFRAGEKDRLVGFAVLGGIFSEGIDLRGDRLNGVIVAGVGLPQLNAERNLIKDHFNNLGKSGYDFAYTYPGMNKVLQAGGRLIRSENDSGAIMLIDDRFLTRKYKQLLPYEWQHFKVYDPKKHGGD